MDLQCIHRLKLRPEQRKSASVILELNDTLSLSATDLYSVQYPVEYCLSQPVQERCTDQLSLVTMAVVIVCNAVKLTCMVLLLRQLKCAPLATIGDAIESFMLDKATTTQGMC